jgi:hypothetical protein
MGFGEMAAAIAATIAAFEEEKENSERIRVLVRYGQILCKNSDEGIR